MKSLNLMALTWVSQKLSHKLRQEIVFLGGATTELFVTDSVLPKPRPTHDVDAIIEVASRLEYQRLGRELKDLGFHEDTTQNAPLCRWKLDDLVFDVMPTNAEILGFTNSWYKQAIQNSTTYPLQEDLEIRLVTAPYFIATKLEAFFSRGNNDYIMSHDLEDILMVFGGRAEIWSEIRKVEPNLRDYLVQSVKHLLAQEDFVDAIPAHLPPDDQNEVQANILISKMQLLTSS